MLAGGPGFDTLNGGGGADVALLDLDFANARLGVSAYGYLRVETLTGEDVGAAWTRSIGSKSPGSAIAISMR